MFDRKRILITGGTGSLGSALSRKWYTEGYQLTILSRDPHKQAALSRELFDIQYILADICNREEVARACIGNEILVHTAANKDVQTGEYHPSEFARVNIGGSLTVTEEWAKVFEKYNHEESAPYHPRLALLIGTDKSPNALNTYGACKKIAEAVFRKRDYSVLRYGNVITSAGSFLHKWQEAKEQGQPITVREPEPTRFCLTMTEAIALIEDVITYLEGGGANGIFVPRNLQGFLIWELAGAFGDNIQREPLLPYEKQHETLVAEGELAEPVTDLIARITPGWGGDRTGYQSHTAPRLTAAQVLEKVQWQITD